MNGFRYNIYRVLKLLLHLFMKLVQILHDVLIGINFSQWFLAVLKRPHDRCRRNKIAWIDIGNLFLKHLFFRFQRRIINSKTGEWISACAEKVVTQKRESRSISQGNNTEIFVKQNVLNNLLSQEKKYPGNISIFC